MYDVDILNYTSVWWNGRKKVEEMMRRVFSPSLPTPTPSMFFPAHFSLHLLQYLNTWAGYSLELEDSSDLREQSWDHCTVSHILSLTDQIILRVIIDVKSNSGAFVRSSVFKLLLLDSLSQFFIYSLLRWETPLKRSSGWFAFAART